MEMLIYPISVLSLTWLYTFFLGFVYRRTWEKNAYSCDDKNEKHQNENEKRNQNDKNEKERLFEKTKKQVHREVLLNQVIHFCLFVAVNYLQLPTNDDKNNIIQEEYSYGDENENEYMKKIIKFSWQFLTGMIILDTLQYCIHRYFHHNKKLYKYHAVHHQITEPFADAAFYNSLQEGFFMDALSFGLTQLLTGMDLPTSAAFALFANCKTIHDHLGMWFYYLDPEEQFITIKELKDTNRFANNKKYGLLAFLVDPFLLWHYISKNTEEYHFIHHQPQTIKFNFQQSFFSFMDELFNTQHPSFRSNSLFSIISQTWLISQTCQNTQILQNTKNDKTKTKTKNESISISSSSSCSEIIKDLIKIFITFCAFIYLIAHHL